MARRADRAGLAYGITAYGCWGLLPIYLKAVRAVPVLEVLCHRIVWAVAFLLAVAWRRGELGRIRAALRERRTLAVLGGSTLLLAVNWLVYIWAVVGSRMIEASLGYYINPLVNVLLGVAVLGETLERPVRVAVALAATGVCWFALLLGRPPWVSLVLALSFGLYGLLRKIAPAGPLVGLSVETLLLLPLAGSYLAWVVASARSPFLRGDAALDALLLLAGPITALPLLSFAAAARRLPLTALGFLQYLSPTIQFLLAVAVYGERFDRARAAAFALIWTALAVFAVHSARRERPEPLTADL